MTTGIVLIIVGVVLGGGALLFAIGNLMRGINNRRSSAGRVLTGHLGAMVVMAIGGLVAIIGLLMVVSDLLKNL